MDNPRRRQTRTGRAAATALAVGLIAGLAPATGFAQSDAVPAQWKACLDGAAPATKNIPPGPNDRDPSRDEVILDFDDDLSDDEVREIASTLGLDVRLNSVHDDAPNIYLATVAEGAVPYVSACAKKSAPAGTIEFVEENYDMQLFEVGDDAEASGDTKPNDPLYQFQWHFGQVNAERAWEVSTGRDVVVAVIDTGVAVEDKPERQIKAARDLEGTEIVDGYDFVDDSDFVFDGHGHGTHVAGTIAQTTNNKYGVAGLAYNAKIMGLRVLNSRGFGSTADIAAAIRFAADNGAQVANLSLGGPLPSLVLMRATRYAYKKGMVVVAAAGNGGKEAPSYPAAFKHVIAVAATQYDQHTTFYSQRGEFVDIAAPGGNTRVDQNGDGRPDGVLQETLKKGRTDEHDFSLFMGTSMASPHVAGAAALVIAQGVTHPDRVEEILTEHSDTSQRERFDDDETYAKHYGAGILQADASVRAAVNGQGTRRFGAGALLLLLALLGVRRSDNRPELAPKLNMSLAASTLFAASGLFFLPLLAGDSTLVAAVSRPIAELDMLAFGPGWHQNPLMASALIPLAAYGLLGGHKKLRFIACGLAIGMAGFCLSEALVLTSDVRWVPGMGLLDQAWLAANGALSFAIGYFGLKRR